MSTSVQTTIVEQPVPGVPGQIADGSIAADTVGGVAGGDYGFGVMVVNKGAGWVLPTADTDFAYEYGVVVRTRQAGTQQGVLEGDSVTVLKRGRIYVAASEALSLGDTVHVNETDGQFTATGSSSTVTVTGARVRFGGSTPAIDLDPSEPSADS